MHYAYKLVLVASIILEDEKKKERKKCITYVSLQHSTPEAAPDSYVEHDQWLQLQL
jgi:hypothetical protein